ncbi:hypothetical protein [Nonomuraea longicatena]|uniref:Uncharacterized protein n=1 Tax=Nonomuraea longicatena TaxID=83682 RepID=A0ABP4A542_9ACTN
MDEFDLLSDSLPDSRPPSPEVTGRARARLSDAMSEPVRPVGSRRSLWGWTAAATVSVVAAVIALVTTLAPATAPVIAPPAHPNAALLRLADQVARLPEERGAYWRRPLLHTSLIRVEAAGRAFNVLSASSADLWQPRDTGDPVQVRLREEYVRPATAEDDRAWKAAGSPLTVQPLCSSGTMTENCKPMRITSRPSACQYTRAAEPRSPFSDRRIGEITLAELAALPADADKLRAKLHDRWRATRDGRPFAEFLSSSWTLLEMPVSPGVRAATLRLLAESPTTRTHGMTTDPFGRPGLAVTFTKSEGFTGQFGSDDEVAERYTNILDPGNGTFLLLHAAIAAESAEGLTKGTFLQHTAWLPEKGWTDDRPDRPRACKLSRTTLP